MSQLDDLISYCERKKLDVVDQAAFLQVLKELKNDVIGIDDIKEEMATHFKLLLSSTDPNERNSMLHAVMYGPPGTGKSTVSKLYARALLSLGYLKVQATEAKKARNEGVLNDVSGMLGFEGNDIFTIYMIVMMIFLVFVIFSTIFKGVARLVAATFALFGITIFLVLAIVILATGYYYRDKIYSAYRYAFPDPQAADKPPTQRPVDDPKGTNKGGVVDLSRIASDDEANREKTEAKKKDDIVVVVSRGDFVAPYVGQTAPKTNKLLQKNLGKVLVVDEAYSLINGPTDQFGNEAITALNLFMTEHPGEIVVIFAGYRDLLEKGVFTEQPGLESRFVTYFEFKPYSGEELYRIFLKQLEAKSFRLVQRSKVLRLFQNNFREFKGQARDMEKMCWLSRLHFTKKNSEPDPTRPKVLEYEDVEAALEMLKKNRLDTTPRDGESMLERLLRSRV